MNKVTEARAEEMCAQLCAAVLTARKAEQRDIASISLKTIVAEASVSSVAASLEGN